MRQVPTPAPAPLGIVGSGRLARHFDHYFSLLGLPVLRWSRRESDRDPGDALEPCATVLVLIADGAIDPFIEAHPGLAAKRLVHCSGRLVTARAAGAHPLMTFGPDLYDLPSYQRIPFIVDAGAAPLRQLLPGLPNPSFAIPAAERPFYHALCVMAGNFSTLLWVELFEQLESRLGVPAAAAHPFLAQTAANVGRHGAAALTGPLVRGDDGTIAANLRALEGTRLHDLYAAFARAYAHRR